MSESRFSRRGFLEQVGVVEAPSPLIGNSRLAAGPFQAPGRACQLNGKAKSVTIPTHEFAGPNGAPWIEERIDFPESWEVHVMDMAGHNMPVLTPQQIAQQCNTPIGSKCCCANWPKAKKTAVVSFDDLYNAHPRRLTP